MKACDVRKARRERERQKSLCGETLADYHARERPAPTAPGAGIPRVRCQHTPDIFSGRTRHEIANPTRDLFDN